MTIKETAQHAQRARAPTQADHQPWSHGHGPTAHEQAQFRGASERARAASDLSEPARGPRRQLTPKYHGTVMRPGALLLPDCVWQELQSPELCIDVMRRSRP